MKNFDLIGKKNYFFAFSLLLTLIGLVGFIVNGITLDLQFQGGTVIQMQMQDDKFDTAKAEQVVSQLVNRKATAQKMRTLSGDKGAQVDLLSVSIASSETLTSDEVNTVIDGLKKEFSNINANEQIVVQNIQPLIGKEMLDNGLKAIFWTCILMIIYIWWRFRTMANSGLSAGVTAVLGLVHDALIMLSVYIVFKIPLNESFIAAILTILGYSINDTIVIYDRIRENTSLLRKQPIAQVVNTSIVQTLTRSVNTGMATIFCIIIILIFASVNNIQSLKEFSFPMLIGITSGTYSSIFISSPVWVLWKEHQEKKRIVAKAAKKA
jgi:preprotein translocase subunit SecF